MGHLINPLLVDGYMDGQPSESAQGCFTGSDYWQAEQDADDALRTERAVRRELAYLQSEYDRMQEEYYDAVRKRQHRRAERLTDALAYIRKRMDECKKAQERT